jgi:hypothetical protein
MFSEYEKLENHTKYHNASDLIYFLKATSLGRPYVPSLLFYTPCDEQLTTTWKCGFTIVA